MPVLNPVLCFVVYTCFVFDCISAVLRDSCWFCCSIMTATIINEVIIIIINKTNNNTKGKNSNNITRKVATANAMQLEGRPMSVFWGCF